MSSKWILLPVLAGLLTMQLPMRAQDTLHGRVQQSDHMVRLSRPGAKSVSSHSPNSPASIDPESKVLVDVSDFDFAKSLFRNKPQVSGPGTAGGIAPFNGLARVPVMAGNVEPSSGKPTLACEADDGEMIIAWEEWHKRVCAAIYRSWCQNSRVMGVAETTILVTRDHHITVSVHNVAVDQPAGFCMPSASLPQDRLEQEFTNEVLATIHSLDGSSVLEFPPKSQRLEVSFAPNFRKQGDASGYDWRKDDYERVPVN